MRFLRRFLLGFRSGMAHAGWGYSLRETIAHLRRPRPFQIILGLGVASTGCLACPSVSELRRVA